jgi:hypothetical protein
MSYTLEQKRDAVKRKELWWMCIGTDDEHLSKWTSVHQDMGGVNFHDGYLLQDGTEYFIGAAAPGSPTAPTPPRVLSELEGELLEALKAVLPYLTDGEDAGDEATQLAPIVRAAIQKAEATP